MITEFMRFIWTSSRDFVILIINLHKILHMIFNNEHKSYDNWFLIKIMLTFFIIIKNFWIVM